MKVLRAALFVLLLAPALLEARRLPVRTYTTADGLARDHVVCVVSDSHGFLWFCTAEGLSRFDGYQFTNYRTQQGLPANAVADFLETRSGVYWVATSGGVCRFNPTGAPRFHCMPPSGGNVALGPLLLVEDRARGVWCGTGNAGLYYLAAGDSAFRHVDIKMSQSIVTALLLDRRGALWVGSSDALYRRDPDGSTQKYTATAGIPELNVMALIEDRTGRLWVGTRAGLIQFDPAPAPHQTPRTRLYTTKDGLPGMRIESLRETSDGTLWVGTSEGLAEWIPTNREAGREFQSYTLAQGLSARAVGALAEDRDGNLWVATFGSGVMKVARSGFSTYTEADGIPSAASLMESRQGELCVFYASEHDRVRMGRFDGRRFAPIVPDWPGNITYFGWGRGQIAVHDRANEWWIATGQGLCRFPRTTAAAQLTGVRPAAVYTSRDGLAGDNIFRVFEDSRSDIWIGTIGLGAQDGLARWDRRTGKMQAFSEADGLPSHPVPSGFAEDRAGNVWVGLFHGGLARYRNGRFTFFPPDVAPGFTHTLFLDSRGRLWIGTSRRLAYIEDPTEERPRFATYTTTQGLSSDFIAAVTEDRLGRIYAATGRGIDRFEPQPTGPGRIKHYTTADGIAPGELNLAFRDQRGTLWFSTPLGLSQFTPAVDHIQVPPPVLVTGLSIGGVAQPISDLGQSAVSGLRFAQTSLRIDFVGLGFLPGEALRYQYRLEGADLDWSAPTDQRTVIYASLTPGSYRFLVRAVASDGSLSPRPAAVVFTIVPPMWRAWWFLLSCGIAVALIVYVFYRYRVAQLVAVANVRTRIATDLHDDIGASLSQIAILSEVAQQANAPGTRSKSPLSEIAGISRELVDAMSDIVWAINPDHDRLSNLVYRMRRFATDLLGQSTALQFRSGVAEHDLRIGADMRRQIYLVFKEGINNIARHSGASRVEVQFEREGEHLVLRLSDNGRGFDAAAEYDGHGLVNMRKRAAALGGGVELRSEAGEGTTLRLTVPLESSRTLSILRGK